MAPLTIEQAAARLGTTTRFIRRLRTERRIAVVKLGKHVRVDRDDLDAYIHASRQEADTGGPRPDAEGGRSAPAGPCGNGVRPRPPRDVNSREAWHRGSSLTSAREYD